MNTTGTYLSGLNTHLIEDIHTTFAAYSAVTKPLRLPGGVSMLGSASAELVEESCSNLKQECVLLAGLSGMNCRYY